MSAAPDRAFRRAFPWVIATLIASHACMAVTRVAASLWVLRQGHGEWTVGLLLSLFAVAPIVLSMPAGRMADRHGFHRPVGASVLMGGFGALLVLLWQGLPAIFISCMLSGGALAMTAVAIQREAGQMAREPGELKRVFSWVALGPAISNSLAPVLAGLLIDHVSFRAAFALALVLPALCWVLALRVPRQPSLAGPAARGQGRAWDLLRHRPLRQLLLLNVVLSACWDAHSFVVPVVGHAKGLSASSIGLVLGAFAAAAVLVRLFIARFAAQLDEMRALRSAMALAMVVLLVYAWLPGAPGLMLGSALLGLALGSVQPMALSVLHQVTPADRHGQALGLRMMASNAATVGMPLGFGLLAGASVAAAPMWLMASMLLLAQWPARALSRTMRSPSA